MGQGRHNQSFLPASAARHTNLASKDLHPHPKRLPTSQPANSAPPELLLARSNQTDPTHCYLCATLECPGPIFIFPLKIPTGNSSWGCRSKVWGREKGGDVESRARSYLCPFFARLQLEKGKNPAQLNKQLGWGWVEPERVENLGKQKMELQRRGAVTSSQETVQQFACKAAGEQGPTPPTARSRGPLHAHMQPQHETQTQRRLVCFLKHHYILSKVENQTRLKFP